MKFESCKSIKMWNQCCIFALFTISPYFSNSLCYPTNLICFFPISHPWLWPSSQLHTSRSVLKEMWIQVKYIVYIEPLEWSFLVLFISLCRSRFVSDIKHSTRSEIISLVHWAGCWVNRYLQLSLATMWNLEMALSQG